MRKLPLQSLFIAIAAAILSSGHALAQITVTGEVSGLGPGAEFIPTPPSVSVNGLLVQNPGNFDVDFSSEGDVPLKFVWKAPAGQCFQVAAPAGFENAYLEFVYELDLDNEPAPVPNLGTIGFRKAKGNLPETVSVNASFAFEMAESLTVNVEVRLEPGEVVTFESFELTFNVASVYDHHYDNIAVDTFGVFGKAFGPRGVTLADPGSWLTLIPAPESRAEALARKASLTRDAKKLKKKFKKAKRKGKSKKARKAKKKFKKAKTEAANVVIPQDPEEFVEVEQEVS